MKTSSVRFSSTGSRAWTLSLLPRRCPALLSLFSYLLTWGCVWALTEVTACPARAGGDGRTETQTGHLEQAGQFPNET